MKTSVLPECVLPILIACMTISCSSRDDSVPTTTKFPPGIIIYDPKEGSIIQGKIEINADVVYYDLQTFVSEVSAEITRDSDKAVVFEDGPYMLNQNFYSYHGTYTPTGLTGSTPMTLVITGKGSGKTATKSVKFTAKP